MGLDMYLIKKKKEDKGKDIDNFGDELIYWRKANAIHNYFVENVQDGVDDCDYYEVDKKVLEDLRDICKEILDKVELIDGKISNGYKYEKKENGELEKVELFEDGKIIKDSSICEELLPTTSGFFFGDTDYNEWYLKDIERTYNELDKILNSFDFENYYIEYTSWW